MSLHGNSVITVNAKTQLYFSVPEMVSCMALSKCSLTFFGTTEGTVSLDLETKLISKP